MSPADDADVVDPVVRGLVLRVREEMPGAEPPQALSDALLVAARQRRPKAKKAWWVPGAASLVLAAAALVLFVSRGDKTRAAEPAVRSSPPAAPPPVVETQAAPAPVVTAQPEPPPPPPPPAPPAKKVPRKVPAADKPALEESTRMAAPDDAPAEPTPRDLLAQAKTAAQKGDCETVATLGYRVQAIDPSFYQRSFATDPAITGCLRGR